jgi:hypothetical protein
MRPDAPAAGVLAANEPRARGTGRTRLRIGRRSLDLQACTPAPDTRATRLDVAGASLEATCSAVQQLLAARAERSVEARLASGLCRLMLLQWNAQLTSAERWKNYARARFEDIFGADFEAWELHLATDLPGRDRVAVAWPARLRDTLAACPAVRSVRVDLLEQMGTLLARESGFSGCLAEIDIDGAAFLLFVDGRLRRIRSCRYDHAEELASALRAEWAALAQGDERASTRPLSIALVAPVAPREAERARALAALSSELGFARTLNLPAWN